MPPKHAARDRAWGTRYDTLKALSPPSSPPRQRLVSSTASSIPHSPSSQHGHESPIAAMSTPTKSERTSHDSSIFVGSLPSSMDHNELTRQLTEHLSEYPEIKNVKVVRDSKGGVCAFAQCENAPSAGRLLEALQSTTQRPFLGRYLRFELARAFRTLLISYRAPATSTYPNSGLESFDMDGLQPAGVGLPTAMRLHKPPNSKYCMVIYDSEARDFEPKYASQTFGDADEAEDPLGGAGLLITPLRFDGETLRKIAMVFGGVEHFGVFVPNAEGSKDAPNVHPHSGPRTTEMDTQIWEIKWEQREDCMNASMTLRNVPHLTVTWAHRAYPDTGSGWESRFGSPTVASSPRFPSNARSRTQSRSHYSTPGDFQSFGPPGMSPSMAALHLTDPSTYVDHSTSYMRPFAYAPPALRAPSSPLSTRATMDSEGSDATLVPDLSDAEFPSLRERRSSHRLGKSVRAGALPWVYEEMPGASDDVFGSESAMRVSPSSSLSVQPSTPTPVNTLRSPSRDAGNSGYEYAESADDEGRSDRHRPHELTIPLTPEFTTASVTPVTPKTAFSFPHTPQSGRSQAGFAIGEFSKGGDFDAYSRKDKRFPDREDNVNKEIDPFSIFAGALDTVGPDPWDEERVKHVFGKYGEIEDIQLIKRMNPFSGFVFVKYTNTKDSANAVAAEHSRSYDGRPIRVQLRELNPTRGPHRFGKNKPRTYRDFSSGYRGQYDGTIQVNEGIGGRFDSSHDVYRHARPSNDLQQMNATTKVSEDTSQPVFPSIAAPAFKAPTSDTSSGPRRPLGDGSNLERPVSSLSGSVSSHPSSSGGLPSMVAPAAAYPMAHPQWAHYAPYGYGVPYGYMGYPPPPTMGYQPGAHPSSGDATAVQQYPWPHQAYAYSVPYPAPPTSSGSNGDQNPPSAQPPVKPVGFMADQGSLVPMYPQDALNQYMTSNGHPSQSPPPTGAQPTAQGPSSMPAWTPYMAGTHAMPTYPYGYQQPMGPAPAQQALAPHSQYAWYPPPAHGQYYPTPAPPAHAAAPSQGAIRGPPPPYSAASGAMTPSASYRAPSYNFPSHPSHLDVGQGPRNFHPAGPRRFTKYQGPGPQGHYAQNPSLHPSHTSVFRHNVRSDNGGSSNNSPPHLERRGSSSLDVPYGYNSEAGQMHAAESQQFVRQQPPHVAMRASGSYPSVLPPNGSLG